MTALTTLVSLLVVPLVMVALALRLTGRRMLQLSTITALVMVVLASTAVVDVEVPLFIGRTLRMTAIAQMGIQLLALAMLGLTMGLNGRPPEVVAHWLPVAWLSFAGLVLALLINTLPLALLVFVASGMLWALGLPPEVRASSSGAVLRYAGLLALVVPLLLATYRLAEQRTVATPELERIVLALAVPGFGLILGLIPLHAWTLSLASGAPREMLFGVVGLVQTAGYILLLRTFEMHAWLTADSNGPLLLGGALSAVAGGWLAASARREDPDDWLVYALVAQSGVMMVGLGTQSLAAGSGVAMLLFARVLALVTLSVAPRAGRRTRRLGTAAATLALAGTPGLAGFPGLWIVLGRLQDTGEVVARRLPYGELVPLALVAGSALLYATAIRRWRAPIGPTRPIESDAGAQRAVWVLIGLLIVVGVAPHWFAPAFQRAVADVFFLFE